MVHFTGIFSNYIPTILGYPQFMKPHMDVYRRKLLHGIGQVCIALAKILCFFHGNSIFQVLALGGLNMDPDRGWIESS